MEPPLSAHMSVLDAFKALFETKSAPGLEALLAEDLARSAIVYVRQSTAYQVANNTQNNGTRAASRRLTAPFMAGLID